MREDDLIRLRHMLDAAREAVHFAKGKSRSLSDWELQPSIIPARIFCKKCCTGPVRVM